MTITAEVIAASITPQGEKILTFEIEYPRIIHSELMTHRVFSRNSASSRAIPVKKMNELICKNFARPSVFGKNQSGMQDAGEHFTLINGYTPEQWWDLAILSAVQFSRGFEEAGYHKQVCNRLTEAGQHMKVVVTATSYDNWFWLRNHNDADPTIHDLANCMLAAYNEAEFKVLQQGEWYVPYYFDGFWSEKDNGLDAHGHTLQEALMISSSCCAQVSYRALDETLEKAEDIYKRLVDSEPVHASPFEHQASPIGQPVVDQLGDWEKGVTHMDRSGNLWSGNFKGWIQHRQLIDNHVCEEYDFG